MCMRTDNQAGAAIQYMSDDGLFTARLAMHVDDHSIEAGIGRVGVGNQPFEHRKRIVIQVHEQPA